MKISNVNEAITEAERFIRAARKAKIKYELEQWTYFEGCKESGAMKRASMDLTRSLSALRRRG